MAATVRICIIGGGSYNWGPTLLRDLAAMDDMTGTIVLHDLDPVAADDLCRLGRRIMEETGASFVVDANPDLLSALTGADFVIVTITTGGLAAMRHDLEIPGRYGIVQMVGDTVGPGGLARGLRNIPVMVEIARTMERVCPDAWLINLTNPMSTLVRAVTKTTRIKTIGLCHELFGARRVLGRFFDATGDDLETEVAGINHLIWILRASANGRDLLSALREHLAGGGELPLAPLTDGPRASFRDGWRVKLALFDIYGALPAAGDRHVAEFFPFFLRDEVTRGSYGLLPTTIEQRVEIQGQARDQVRGWLDGHEPLSLERSQEEVADIIAAVAHGRSRKAIVNLPNQGQIDNLPRGAVVETMGMVGPGGASGISVGALPSGVLATIVPHLLNQELIVEAALTGDRRPALEALVGDPLVRDVDRAPRLLDELLRAQAAYLPQWAG